MVYSNLGGQGPLAPLGASAGVQGIRYVNVGSVFTPFGTIYLDLVLTNQSSYTPYDASLNQLNGQFAQVNLACNHAVELRTTIKVSCASGASCKLCDALSGAAKTSCYSAGCACYGTSVTSEADCSGASKEAMRASYDCPALETVVVLPRGSMVSMTVYDFDTGPLGDYVESLTVPEFAYYKTPLRPATDNIISSTLSVDLATGTFSATASGSSSDNPTEPTTLTDSQASKGVQFFFRSQNGYIDATFSVTSTTESCTGRNLLFAGDSSLCAPPPPQPPGMPPPSLPPPSPSPPSLPPSPLWPPTAPTVARSDPNATAALEAEVEAVARSVTAAMVTSLTASLGVSVLSAAGAAAATAGAAAAATGAASSAGGAASSLGGGGGGGGGGMLPLIFGAQRFACSSGLGSPTSEVQRGVADSMAWIEGDLGLVPPSAIPFGGRGRARRLETSGDVLPPVELTKLFNLLVVFATALILTVLIQYTLILLWRHVVNRRYYAYQRHVALQRLQGHGAADDAKLPPVQVRACLGCGPKRLVRRSPKFFPFPKSLVWPTPLYFTCCIFVTGLTRSSVRLLAVSPPHAPGTCGLLCPAAAITVLATLTAFLSLAIVDLVHLHRQLVPTLIRWKPAARQPDPAKLGDPWLRWRAKARVQLMSAWLLVTSRVSSSSTAEPTKPPRAEGYRSSAQVVPAEAWGDGDETGTTHGLGVAKKPARPLGMRQARSRMIETLANRGGHVDRKSGGYVMPPSDAIEPDRTERLLARPFQLWRSNAADAFQSREGFFMFRVNGGTFVGRWYRVLAVLANMVFGLLSGLQPLLSAGSTESLVQTGIVLGLQTIMAILCCRFKPDADRIISTFAATQFVFEASSTAAVLVASIVTRSTAEPDDEANPTAVTDRVTSILVTSGFFLSLAAMGTPMLQLTEQRLITPMIGVCVSRGCNVVALCAGFYMLAASLPRKLGNMINAITGFEDAEGTEEMAAAASGSASADAGDDAAEAEDNAGDRDVGAADSGDGATGGQGVQADELADAAVRASRLLARAAAAKEAGGQAIAPPPEAANVDASVTAVHSLIHLRHRSYKSAHTHGVEGDIDDMRIDEIEDGGDDG